MPALAKPSATQPEAPNVAGPVVKLPLSALCQQDGKNVLKVSINSGTKASQVVNEISEQPTASPIALKGTIFT